jgi:hypothetical protein
MRSACVRVCGACAASQPRRRAANGGLRTCDARGSLGWSLLTTFNMHSTVQMYNSIPMFSWPPFRCAQKAASADDGAQEGTIICKRIMSRLPDDSIRATANLEQAMEYCIPERPERRVLAVFSIELSSCCTCELVVRQLWTGYNTSKWNFVETRRFNHQLSWKDYFRLAHQMKQSSTMDIS